MRLWAIAIGLFLALLVPSLALADDAPTAAVGPTDTELAPTTSEAAQPADEATAPADTATPPADTATPSADGQATTTTPVTTTPAAPPSTATETPVTSQGPTAPVLPASDQSTPTPGVQDKAPAAPVAPAIPETAPTAAPPVVAPLPVTPDAPKGGPDRPTAGTADMPTAPVQPPIAERVPSRTGALAAASLGAPTAPSHLVKVLARTSQNQNRFSTPPGSSFTRFTGFEPPSASRVAPSPVVVAPSRVGPLDGGGLVSGADEVFSPSMAPVPGSRVPGSGASLLSVLAGYVLPGGGTMPGATLFVFVQLAVLLLVGLAGPGGRGMVIRGVGGVGAAAGHAMAVRRPG